MTEANFSAKRQQPEGASDPIADPAIRRQLERMFGESLFGQWSALAQGTSPTPRRRSYAWIWKLGIVAAIALAVWTGRVLFKPGLERQVEDQRGNYATELQSFVNDGDLAHAEQFVPLVQAGKRGTSVSSAIEPNDPHLDLLVGTEALLYRYHDANPERLTRIRPFIDSRERSNPRRQLAALTVVSREERAMHLAELERLHNELPNDNELEYLLATALEQSGVESAAKEAWERSAKLGPAWLGQRFEQAWFEWHRDRKPAAEKTARQILRVDPDSAWAKLAITTFALPKDIAVESVRGDAAAPATTAVQRHFEQLQQSIVSARQADMNQSKAKLLEAMASIRQQPPFMLDAFDWLLIEGQTELARELTNLADWPKDSLVAMNKLARLSSHTKQEAGRQGPNVNPEVRTPSHREPTRRKATRAQRKR